MRRSGMLIALGAACLLCEPVGAADNVTAPVGGELPTGEALHWGEEPVEVLTAKRAQVCLNGIWRFVPASGPAETDPEGSWGYIRVPGDWREATASRPVPGVVAKGTGEAWSNYDGRALAKAWYERAVSIPADWVGRAVLLKLARVSTDARVFVNGTLCGEVNWPSGTVDITGAVTPGAEATVRMLVVATPDEGELPVFMGPNQVSTKQADLNSRGVTGDVLLVSRPQGPHISDVFVRPSTRRKELALEIEITGLQQAGEITLDARLLDEKGREEKRFAATTRGDATDTQTTTVSWSWPDPRLWDVGQPNLYILKLTATGCGLDDEYAQQFGFRELWIDGRDFYLNGTKFRMRPVIGHVEGEVGGVRELIDGCLDGFQWAGFNIKELWPWNEDERGTIHYRQLWAQRADEKGFPLMGVALSMSHLVADWRRPGVKERWERRMATELREYRNHPSILLWATSANRFGHADDQNPRRVGKKEWPDDEGWRQAATIGEEACGIIRSHDPTRPVMVHQGGPVGDVYALNSYLCMIPLQEREEWLSEWARDGDMPYMVVEFGTPLYPTLLRGRDGYGNSQKTEPLVTEFCAIYFGEDAYRTEPRSYREAIRERFVSGQEYKGWHGNREIEFAENHQMLQALFNTNTYRSWRTMGISGGMIPWSNAHGWDRRPPDSEGQTVDIGPFTPGRRGTYLRHVPRSKYYAMRPEGMTLYPSADALIAANGPTLAWITGPEGEFTARDHHFYSGTTVRKQVALLNDERAPVAFRAQWTVRVGGTSVLRRQTSGTLAVGETRCVPIRFDTPQVSARTDGEIQLTATVGDREHTDLFPFRVYPRLPGTQMDPVAVFDPEGATTALLRAVGVDTRPWDGKATPGRVLVIGRHALDAGAALPGSLEDFVRQGGRAIMLGQKPEWLREAIGLRVARHVSRRFWPVQSQQDHPLVAGLDADDFRDWRGAGTLVPDQVAPTDRISFPGTYQPPWGWHWGNRGSVSSAAIEKPHHAGWTPILEGEFDLAYSPLMELSVGKGLLIWCMLDLEGRQTVEPVADIITRRLLGYAAAARPEPRTRSAWYLGGSKAKALLEQIGLIHEDTETIPPAPALLVVGAEAPVDDAAMRAFLAAGGRALFLPREAGDLPLGYEAQTRESYGGASLVPLWPECHGLSASDLRLRADIEAPLLVDGTGDIDQYGQLGRLEVGRGVALFTQLEPSMLDADIRTYLRYSAWRVTRTLTQLLTNLGGAFHGDRKSFARIPSEQDPISPAGGPEAVDLYYPGFRTDYALGDDPYRYYRW